MGLPSAQTDGPTQLLSAGSVNSEAAIEKTKDSHRQTVTPSGKSTNEARKGESLDSDARRPYPRNSLASSTDSISLQHQRFVYLSTSMTPARRQSAGTLNLVAEPMIMLNKFSL